MTAKGLFCIFAAAVCFGMMPVWAKLAYETGMDPLALIVLRTVFATIVLLVWFVLKRRPPVVPRGSRVPTLATCCLYAAMMISYFYACQDLDSGIANALYHLYPVIIAVLSVMLGKSRATLRTRLTLAIALVGFTLLANIGSAAVRAESVALILLAAVLFALYSLKLDTDKMESIDPFALTFYICVTSCVVAGGLWFANGSAPFAISAGALAYALLIALFSTVFGLAAYIEATQILGPVKASILSNAEVVITFAAGALLLSESISTESAIGCALIVAACVLACARQSKENSLESARKERTREG